MQTYLVIFAITFTIFITAAFVINFCKRKVSRTNHGLTGMCHKDGGTMCSCCSEKLTAPAAHSANPTANRCR